MHTHSDSGLVDVGGLDASERKARSAAARLSKRLRRWWTQQTTILVEDEVVDAGSGRAQIRLVVPLVSPVLIIPALVLRHEPENVVALLSLVYGAAALLYGLLAGLVERRVASGFWIQLLNGLVYAALISAVLWTFLTFEHPRPHLHWVVFFLYFLLIGSTGLSDDPRQPVSAGAFSIIGYFAVIPLVERAAAAGSPMAVRVMTELGWVANGAKIALLVGATLMAIASAKRGRTVRRMSLRDGLTGLLNRHAFDQCLERLAKRAQRTGRPMTIAMIDIDHFKRLNDAHGHATGDAVLRWVAAWLRRSFRSSDVVARYGGEEFVVAFLDSDDDRLCTRLDLIRQGIERATLEAQDSGLAIRVTVSTGIAWLPGDGDSVTDVLACADERLYAAKAAGRNCIVGARVGD